MRLMSFLVSLLLFGFSTFSAHAQQTDETRRLIDGLNASLLDVMRDAKSLGFQGRVQKLTPVLNNSYSFAEMARIVIGSQWKTLDEQQKAKVIDSFARLSIATYAARINESEKVKAETLSIDPVPAPDTGLMAKTHFIGEDGVETKMVYRLRQTAEGWRIIDVFYQGNTSELATQRSQYATLLKESGYEALIKKIDEKIVALGQNG